MPRSERGRPKGRRSGSAPAEGTGSGREWPWVLAVVLSVLPLAWACRGAPFGVPIADEFDHLYWLLFSPSLNPFDAMGSPFYWRPVGRQLYYVVTSPLFFGAQWSIALLHGALFALLGVVVYRVARRGLPPAAAASAAMFPILSEPARALLVSPNGEMMLAVVFAAVTVHEALHRRIWTAAAAALAALLSHGAALLVIPALPAIAWFQERRALAAARWTLASAAVAAIWLIGHLLGRSRGTLLMAHDTLDPGSAVGAARALALSVSAVLNLEDLASAPARIFLLAMLAVFALGAVILWRDRPAGRRRAVPWPAILGALAWFLLGTVPLALVSDWNGWRTAMTGLWLGVAGFGLLWSARPWLAVAFFALRLGALLAAVPAPAPGGTLPETASRFGFARLARLQQYVGALHEGLRQDPPPAGAVVYLSHAPENFAFATAGNRALRVWFRDPTLDLSYITRYQPEPGTRPRRFLRFDPQEGSFAVLPNPLVDAVVEGEEALAGGRPGAAREALGRALGLAQAGVSDILRVELWTSFGVAAHRTGDTTAARLAWQTALTLDPADRGALLNLAAWCAGRGEFRQARDYTRAVLTNSPHDPLGLYYLARLERALGDGSASDEAWRLLVSSSPAFADSVARQDGVP